MTTEVSIVNEVLRRVVALEKLVAELDEWTRQRSHERRETDTVAVNTEGWAATPAPGGRWGPSRSARRIIRIAPDHEVSLPAPPPHPPGGPR